MEVLEQFDAAEIKRLLAEKHRFWLRLRKPEPETLHELGELLGLSPTAINDSIEFGQRPKIEDYPNSALLVAYGSRTEHTAAGLLPRPIEVHFHITADAIVTVRHENVTAVGDVRRRISLDDIDTSEEALYRVLDGMAATFGPALSSVDDEVDRLEVLVLDNPRPELRQRLLELKHSLVRMRQVVDGQRDELAGRRDLLDLVPGFHDPRSHDTLRDVYDRLVVVSNQLDSVRDSVSSALDLYVSAVSNRLNEIMKVLTIVATFYLPLTFVTGFFGQNFGWMVKNVASREAFLLLGVGISLAIIGGLSFWFVRAGYITLPGGWGRRTAEDTPGP